MKKYHSKIVKCFLSFMLATTVAGCGFLDKVWPDDTPSLDHVFANRMTLERMLFTCYRYLPDPTDPYYYPAYFTAKGEFDYGLSSWISPRPAPAVCRGELNTNNPLLNYWSGEHGGTSMYEAIRYCNIFLEGAHRPRDIDEWERKMWIAEVKTLKAYYHFFLMSMYGPIVLAKENVPLDVPSGEMHLFREPVDVCADYIAELIDDAMDDLMPAVGFPTNEDGRMTQPIALAIKAKALVWAASPLFNGNRDYRGWKDSRDRLLIPDIENPERWRMAAAAIKAAIDKAHETGHHLYRFNKRTDSRYTSRMSDTLALTLTARKAVTERWNRGVIWSSTERFLNGKGGLGAFGELGNMQRLFIPVMFTEDVGKTFGYCQASFEMAELYYTKNGLPIDEDPAWDYDNRYKLQLSVPNTWSSVFIRSGEQSAVLNFDREARFYAGLGFDRGYYELEAGSIDGKQYNQPEGRSNHLKLRAGEEGNLNNPIGYYVKKLVAFESSGSRGNTQLNYTGYDYRFPLIRLADLYLLYSEALNEVYPAPNNEVHAWVDSVRMVAGLKGVVESWMAAKNPSRPFDKVEMREIIRQERLIELAFEGQRFWDVRRWQQINKYWAAPPKGWDMYGKTAEEYYTLVSRGAPRNVTNRDYLWPIKLSELRANPNLVQTYGW